MADELASVFIMRMRGDDIIAKSWLVTEATADALVEGLTERLGPPAESMSPVSATEEGWEKLVAAGAVLIYPEATDGY